MCWLFCRKVLQKNNATIDGKPFFCLNCFVFALCFKQHFWEAELNLGIDPSAVAAGSQKLTGDIALIGIIAVAGFLGGWSLSHSLRELQRPARSGISRVLVSSCSPWRCSLAGSVFPASRPKW